jgi:hypothetical protein
LDEPSPEVKLMRFYRSAARQTRPWIAALVLALIVPSPGRAQPAITVVQQWNVIATDTIVPKTYQNEGLIYMAYVSAAMYDAAVRLQEDTNPYGFETACGRPPHTQTHRKARFEPEVPPGASLEAA